MAKMGGVAGMCKGPKLPLLGERKQSGQQNPSQVSLSDQYSLNYTPRRWGHLQHVTVKADSFILQVVSYVLLPLFYPQIRTFTVGQTEQQTGDSSPCLNP